MRHFTSNDTDQCRNGSSNHLIPHREQPRSTRIVVAYPRPTFSATKRTNHAPISFDQQAQVSQGHSLYIKKKEKGNTEVHVGGGLELVKPAREPASRRPKPCAFLKKPHESCPYNVGEKPTVILYTYISCHAGTPNKTRTEDTMSLDYSSLCNIRSTGIGWVSMKEIY